MRRPVSYALFSGLVVLTCAVQACTSDVEPTGGAPTPAGSGTSAGEPPAGTPPATQPSPPAKPADDPGPKPVGCNVQPDKDGFFKRTSGAISYVGFVPKGYAGAPSRLLVGLHGCGDTAQSFADWGVAPYETRDTVTHLGISVDGATGNGNCWSVANDAAKVLAAIDDMATCFYVHKQKVVLAGYSSGGLLAYSVGMKNAARFAGILIENSAVGSAPIASASWKLNIAHRAHLQDDSFLIANVRKDWDKLKAAGFPLETSEVPGGHDGTSEDWATWLIPQMEKGSGWKAP